MNMLVLYVIFVLAALSAFLVSRNYRRFPAFGAYLVIVLFSSFSYACFYEPYSHSWWVWHWLLWQPLLALTQVAAALEVYYWSTLRLVYQEPTYLMSSLLGFSVMAGILVWQWPDLHTDVAITSMIVRSLHTGVAMFLCCGLAAFLIENRRPCHDCIWHALAFTAFQLNQAICDLAPKFSAVSWQSWQDAWYTISILCMVGWTAGALRQPVRLVA